MLLWQDHSIAPFAKRLCAHICLGLNILCAMIHDEGVYR